MSGNVARGPWGCELYAVEIRTHDWPPLVAWYREALGLRVLLRVVEDEYALLAAGASRVAIVGRRDPIPVSSRMQLIFEVDDLESTCHRLREFAAEVSESSEHGEGFWQATVIDPDGNRLRLIQWPQRREIEGDER
ncbi:MAG: VOC family protein [Planctomycetales bacterium]|nr:VOC family protein [Planctomycetales bacterium]